MSTPYEAIMHGDGGVGEWPDTEELTADDTTERQQREVDSFDLIDTAGIERCEHGRYTVTNTAAATLLHAFCVWFYRRIEGKVLRQPTASDVIAFLDQRGGGDNERDD